MYPFFFPTSGLFYSKEWLDSLEASYQREKAKREEERQAKAKEVDAANRRYVFAYLDGAQPKPKSRPLLFMGVQVDESWPVEKLFQLIHDLAQRQSRWPI